MWHVGLAPTTSCWRLVAMHSLVNELVLFATVFEPFLNLLNNIHKGINTCKYMSVIKKPK